jgi:hypothetical protein
MELATADVLESNMAMAASTGESTSVMVRIIPRAL